MIIPIRSKFRAISKPASLKDFFESISWSTVEKMAFFSIFLVVLMPFTKNAAAIACQILYNGNVNFLRIFKIAEFVAIVSAVPLFIIYIGKNIVEKYTLRQFFKDNPAMLFFITYVLCMFISTAINGYTKAAKVGTGLRHESIYVYFMYFMVFYFCASLIRSEKLKAFLEYTFILGSIFMAVCQLLHIYVITIEPFICDDEYIDMVNAIFINSNHYAYYLTISISMCSVFILTEKNKLLKCFSVIGFLLNTYILVLNNTLGCFISTLAAIILVCIIINVSGKKFDIKTLAPLAAYLLIFFVMSFDHPTIMSNLINRYATFEAGPVEDEPLERDSYVRLRLWRKTIDYILEKPLFGFGTDGIMKLLDRDAECERTHNEFLQYTAFYGIPAGICYVVGHFSVFLKALKYRYSLDRYTIAGLAGGFSYLVSSFFGISLYYTAPFLFIFMGLGLCGKKHK